jgi:predicted transcriptional regulator
MSMKPRYVDMIMEGKKKIEVRRRFAARWINESVKLYSSKPEQALRGEATVEGVVQDTPSRIWERFGPEIGCTKQEYDEYTNDAQVVCAIKLGDVRSYSENVPIADLSALVDVDLCPPQSYCELGQGKPWAEAVSIAALLQNHYIGQRSERSLEGIAAMNHAARALQGMGRIQERW